MAWRPCSFNGDVGAPPNTWRERLIRKLGTDFRVEQRGNRSVISKRVKVKLWDDVQIGWIAVAQTVPADDLPDNANPLLETYSQNDMKHLTPLLSNRWKLALVKS